jgi:hypothetical protein
MRAAPSHATEMRTSTSHPAAEVTAATEVTATAEMGAASAAMTASAASRSREGRPRNHDR